jgi:pilus assembly protein Flp/PilA
LFFPHLRRKSPKQPADELHTGKGTAVMQQIRRTLTSLPADVRGVTALEYAMIASLIAVACVAIIGSLGGQVSGVFSTVSSAL